MIYLEALNCDFHEFLHFQSLKLTKFPKFRPHKRAKTAVFKLLDWSNWFHVKSEWQKKPAISTLCNSLLGVPFGKRKKNGCSTETVHISSHFDKAKCVWEEAVFFLIYKNLLTFFSCLFTIFQIWLNFILAKYFSQIWSSPWSDLGLLFTQGNCKSFYIFWFSLMVQNSIWFTILLKNMKYGFCFWYLYLYAKIFTT